LVFVQLVGADSSKIRWKTYKSWEKNQSSRIQKMPPPPALYQSRWAAKPNGQNSPENNPIRVTCRFLQVLSLPFHYTLGNCAAK
jgi:hypothetical protein